MALSKIDLNIVSFDVPFPANYGGVIDVFYKVRALHEAGIKVSLHCFDYGRGVQTKLNEICEEVHYYQRSKSPFKLLAKMPYVVSSRCSPRLLNNLTQNKAPVLFEGLHTSCFLTHPDLKDRQKMVRMHNIEHDYYQGLAQVEKSAFKRAYFKQEARKLKAYESVLSQANQIFAISPADFDYLNATYGRTSLLPVFHSSEHVESLSGKGAFAFYHGNLSVGENNEAALFLVNEVFSQLPHSLIIAGNGPSKELEQACLKHEHIALKSDLETEEIHDLVKNAHVNVLPTFQATGIKLKLILSLFLGRFCIANNEMVLDTGLEKGCVLANSADEWCNALDICFSKEFLPEDIQARKTVLSDQFCNQTNVKILTKFLS